MEYKMCPLKGLLLCLLIVLTSGPAVAKTSLWKVTHNAHVMYIAGTIHALPANTAMPEEFDQAYQQAELLVFEADLKKMSSPGFINKMQSASLLPMPQTLRTVLTPEVYKLLQDYMTANGLPMAGFESIKPSMLSLTITLRELSKLGFDNEGVDKRYFDRAFVDNKGLRFLETPEFQMNLMLNMGKDDPSSLLQYTFDQVQGYEAMMTSTLAAWKTGDSQVMDEMIISPVKTSDPQLYSQLFVERNQRWIDSLIPLLNTPQIELVMVGAGHLYGDESVIQMLKDRGYKVQQL